jgi:hypothetical protein
VTELVRELLSSVVVNCCCEKLVAKAGALREPRGGGTSAVRNRYRVTANDMTVDTSACSCVCVCVIVNCKV